MTPEEARKSQGAAPGGSNASDDSDATTALGAEAAVNAQDTKCRTPLHLIVACGHANFARLLIERSANINAKDAAQKTPMQLAAECGRNDIAKLLAGTAVKRATCAIRLVKG